MYGSPSLTSQAQYPIGSLTWFNLVNVSRRRLAPNMGKGKEEGRPGGVPSSSNSLKIRFGYPGVPVGLERR